MHVPFVSREHAEIKKGFIEVKIERSTRSHRYHSKISHS